MHRDLDTKLEAMNRMNNIAVATSLVLAGPLGITACAGHVAAPSPAAPAIEASPEPTYLTELPAWAREDTGLWLVHSEGLVHPDGVEYYDPEIHDGKSGTDKAMVRPADG